MQMRHLGFLSIVFAFVFSVSSVGAAEETPPPWKKPPEGGVRFTVPGVNNVPDLHGHIENPDLIIFFGGNQFMVLPDIMAAFQQAHPQYRKIFYETLPPGILEQQIKTGSLVIGNLKITHRPDMFVAGEKRLRDLDKSQGYFESIRPYFKNRLAIMVYQGNPKGIQSLTDLGREDVRVSMPNPETEGIAEKAMEAYRKTGGEDLVTTIMDQKKGEGTTSGFCQFHHQREGEIDLPGIWIYADRGVIAGVTGGVSSASGRAQ